VNAAAPVVDVVTQLEAGTECAPCAKLAEHKPAVALHKGIPVCRRCHNLRRAQEQAQSVPVQIPDDEFINTYADLLVPKAPATATPAPRVLSKEAYLEQFGPANNDDLARMVRDLKPGQVFILPFTEEETAWHAKRRALKLIAPNCPNSDDSPGTWKISVNRQHRHVVIERGSRGENSGYLDLPICPPVRPSVQAQKGRPLIMRFQCGHLLFPVLACVDG